MFIFIDELKHFDDDILQRAERIFQNPRSS